MPPVSPRLALLLVCAGLLLVMASYGVCVQDDAYISFRYARNLAEGHGLVFNPGERVEGYTNFLWTLAFAPLIGLGLDPTVPALVLGVAATLALLWSAWELGGRHWLLPLLVATFPGLSLEAVQGLESTFFAFLVCQSLRGGPRWWLWAGLAALTRPEGYAVFGLLWLTRGRSLRDLGAFAALSLPHLLFRVVYYGDIVPNTFHAKVGSPEVLQGAAVPRGLAYLGSSAWAALPLFAALVLGLGLLARRRELRGDLARAALLVGSFATYIVAVGGDFKGTGRFVLPALAPVALLACAGLAALSRPTRPLLALAAVLWAVPGWQTLHGFAERRADKLVQLRDAGLFLKETLPPDTELAVSAIGLVPYYSELPTIDMWGLTDAHIAKAPVDGFGTGTPGHERQDFAYVRARRPALILPGPQLVTPEPLDLGDPGFFGEDFLAEYEARSVAFPHGYLNLWLRRDLTRD